MGPLMVASLSRTGMRRARTPAQQLWLACSATAVVLMVAYVLLPPAWRSLLFTGVTVMATLGMVVGIVVNKPEPRGPWVLLTLGVAVWVPGTLVWDFFEYVRRQPVPVPSAADAFFLLQYPLQAVALLWLLRSRGRTEPNRAAGIDSAILVLGVAVVMWVFVVAPSLNNPPVSAHGDVVVIAYPLADILLFSVLARFLLDSSGPKPAAFHLIVGGLAALFLTDVAWASTLLTDSFVTGSPIYLGWMVFLIALATAMLHPDMTRVAGTGRAAPRTLSRVRLAFLTCAALATPLLLIFSDRAQEQARVLGAATALLFALVMTRMYGLMVDIAQYRRVERLKDEFVSVVSHELRTPLTSIRGSLGLLAGGALGPMPEKAQRMLQIASTNADRLVRLINDILDIERVESNQVPLRPQTCDAADLVARAVDEMSSMAASAQVSVTCDIPPGVQLWADPDRILQTVTNLLSNAVKFSPAGSTVHVRVEPSETEVVVCVQDQGRGIPGDNLESIFDRFAQVDASDSREKGGSGLGLAICRSIVSQHGGRIWAESRVDQGSTFRFTLPQPARPSRKAAAASTAPLVLVIDDDASVAEVVCEMLAQRGYRTEAALSAHEAVATARQRPPDAVLLDLLLPDSSGWDVLARLRRSPASKDVPVIILSGLSRGEVAAPRTDYVDWVEKPIDEDVLFAALGRALHERPLRSVLVVEDDADLAAVLCAGLARHGIDCTTASTGGKAVVALQRSRPDLLILDLLLPDRDGLELLTQLRGGGDLPGVPVVVYTAKDLLADELARVAATGSLVFTKSRITPGDFEARVVRILEGLSGSGPTLTAARPSKLPPTRMSVVGPRATPRPPRP